MIDFSKQWFWALDEELRKRGLDSDVQSFDEIKQNLQNRKVYSPDEFANHCVYVILAGGFSQQTAKKIYAKITEILKNNGANFDDLIAVFNNKNKISAICKVWENRNKFCEDYYMCDDLDSRILYLQKLPHVGKITANHLARNLGEDVVKYDIWIQRLGVAFATQCAKSKAQRAILESKINNGELCDEIKNACDDMFAHLCAETGLPRGYIDVVLWKSCQVKLISMDDYLHKPPVM